MEQQDRLFTPRFFAMWLFAFVTFFSAFQLLPAIPFRIQELGGSKTLAGSFLTAYTLASAIAAPITGAIADRIGRRRMLVTASVLFIFFSLAYGVIEQLALLLLIGIVHGALWSGILSSSSAIMAELIPVARRTQGLAYWGLASTFAFAVAPAVGIEVHHRWGWGTLCVELAVLSVFMSVWSTRLPAHEPHEDAKVPGLSDSWDFRVMKIALSMAVTAIGYGGLTSYVAIYALELNLKPPSLYFTVFALTVVFIRLTTSHLGDRYGTKAVLYPSLAMIPMSLAILAITTRHWHLVTSAILFGIGFGGAFPAIMAFLVSNTDPARRARTFGSFVGAFDTGIGLGSISLGAIGERWGLPAAFAISAAISCLAMPIFAVASRGLSNGTPVAADREHVATE